MSDKFKKIQKSEKFLFEKLGVYQRAVDFANRIHELTKQFPKNVQFGIADQLRRAALSIALNIAEGSGCYHKGEKKQFYRISRRSVFECVPALAISRRQEFISQSEYQSLYAECYELSRMIAGLITSVDRTLK